MWQVILYYLEDCRRAIWTACCGCGSPTTTSRRYSPRAAASRSATSLSCPPLFLLVSIRPNLPLVRLLPLPLLALRWPRVAGSGRGRSGGRAPEREEARRWPRRKPWRDRRAAGQVRRHGWLPIARGGGWFLRQAARNGTEGLTFAEVQRTICLEILTGDILISSRHGP